MSKRDLKYLGKEGNKHVYKNMRTGKIFESKKMIADIEAEHPENPMMINDKSVYEKEEEIMDKLAEKFAADLHERTRIAPANELQETFERAVDDVRNVDIKQKDVKEQTGKITEKLHQEAVVYQVKNNKSLQKKVLASAEEDVMNEISIRRLEQEIKLTSAKFDSIKDAAENLGIDSHRPMWQLKIAEGISSFWFIVWMIIASVTFTPVIFFLKRIRTMIKSAGLAWFFTILFYVGMLLGVYIILDLNSSWGWIGR